MWIYEKKLQFPVKITQPDGRMAKIILSQFGGPDGELAASIRYLSQKFTMVTPEAKATLNDIATEELAHLEMVGAMVHQLTQGLSKDEIIAARALACIGDAQAAMNNLDAALASYKSAAAAADNLLAANYLLKAGIICEEMGKPAEALKFYEEIKTKYAQSPEGFDINKYISRIQNAQ